MNNALTLVLATSVLLQLAAAVMALQLAWKTGWWRAWSLVCLAICGMAARRIVSFSAVLSGEADLAGGLATELVALGISVAMVSGLAMIGPYLRRMWESDRAIRESEARYRAMVDAVDGLVYVCSPEYRIEFMNAALIERTGYDATGELCYQVLHDRETPCPWCVNERVWAGESVTWEVQSPKDGRYYHVHNTPIRHADGRVSKQAVIFDITERKEHELEIQRLKERFVSVIEGVKNIDIHAINADGQIVYWSHGAERMYGYAKSQMLGKNLVDLLVRPDDREAAWEIIHTTFETGQAPPPMEFTLLDREGQPVDIYCDHALVGSDGGPAELFCLAADLRPLRQAQQKAVELEERLHRLVENTQDIIVIHDLEGYYEYYHGPSSYGVKAEDMIGVTPVDLFGEEKGRPIIEQLQKVAASSVPMTTRNAVEWQGQTLWFEDHIFPMRSASGEVTQVGKICRNVTQTVRAEQNLQRRDRVLEAAGQAADAFLRNGGWDRHIQEVLATIGQAAGVSRAYVFQNHRDEAGRLLSSQRYEWVAEGISPQIDCPALQGMDLAGLRAPYLQVLQEGGTIANAVADLPEEHRHLLEDQDILSIAAVPIFVAGELWGFIGFDDCWAERVWSQAELGALKLAADLLGGAIHHDRLSAHMLTANKLESIGMLAGGIAHDFNNILTAIAGNVSLAKLGNIDPDEMSDMLSEAEDACTRAKNLVRQLMTFSRGAAPRPEEIDLAKLLDDTAATLKQQDVGAIEVHHTSPVGPVSVDADQISQVVRNLVLNACQASPSGKAVHITARNVQLSDSDEADLPAGVYAKISVIDHGTGIAPAHQTKIFDPYFTTHSDRSGLGLSAAYALVRKHGGDITLTSTVGKGSRFDIYLPTHRDVARVTADSDTTGSADNDNARRPRVLIMDDEASVRHLVSRMLERMGMDVVTTDDGRAAVDAYRDATERGEPFDLVVMDLLVAGGMGGQQATAEILAEDPDAKIIVASGYCDTPVLSAPEDYGFCGQIAKPFDVADFERAVREALDATTT